MIRFYALLFLEFLFAPFLYARQVFLKNISLEGDLKRYRKDVDNDSVVVGIHDWVGYSLDRKKTVNDKVFDCGLNCQLARVSNYKGTRTLNLSVTISGSPEDNYDKFEAIPFTKVSNIGMDFSGYAHTLRTFSKNGNCYVLLMNSSIEALQVDFIDEYINFLEENKDVGLLGISYATKMYQTLIRNNFTPHVQSFFLLSTVDVLNSVVEANGGRFPGEGILHKRLLIRCGEVRLSKIIMKLGYRLAIIDEQGKPYIFPRAKGLLQTPFKQWRLPMGEYRHHVQQPNRINKLNTMQK